MRLPAQTLTSRARRRSRRCTRRARSLGPFPSTSFAAARRMPATTTRHIHRMELEFGGCCLIEKEFWFPVLPFPFPPPPFPRHEGMRLSFFCCGEKKKEVSLVLGEDGRRWSRAGCAGGCGQRAQSAGRVLQTPCRERAASGQGSASTPAETGPTTTLPSARRRHKASLWEDCRHEPPAPQAASTAWQGAAPGSHPGRLVVEGMGWVCRPHGASQHYLLPDSRRRVASERRGEQSGAVARRRPAIPSPMNRQSAPSCQAPGANGQSRQPAAGGNKEGQTPARWNRRDGAGQARPAPDRQGRCLPARRRQSRTCSGPGHVRRHRHTSTSAVHTSAAAAALAGGRPPMSSLGFGPRHSECGRCGRRPPATTRRRRKERRGGEEERRETGARGKRRRGEGEESEARGRWGHRQGRSRRQERAAPACTAVRRCGASGSSTPPAEPGCVRVRPGLQLLGRRVGGAAARQHAGP